MAPHEREAPWTEKVLELCDLLHWDGRFHVLDTDPPAKVTHDGWPDWTLWREGDREIRVELKGALTPVKRAQWLTLLSQEAAGVECYVWRPVDWDQAVAVLTHRGGPWPHRQSIQSLAPSGVLAAWLRGERAGRRDGRRGKRSLARAVKGG